jgi:hypothetical protein
MFVIFLQENRDVFAWKTANMPGVPRELIEHKLHVDPKSKPVKQHLRCFAQDKKYLIKKEIARLLDVGFIREVYHPDWLANPILVVKRIKIGGCVLIIQISTTPTKKILLA